MKALDTQPELLSVAIIIPVHNEVDSLDALLMRINNVTRAMPYSWSFIFVDDHSTDASLKILKQHRETDSRIGIITLSRCFGKEYALSAGIAHVDADAVSYTHLTLPTKA